MKFMNALKRGLEIGGNVVRRLAAVGGKVHHVIHSAAPLASALANTVGSSIGGTKAERYGRHTANAIQGLDAVSGHVNRGLQHVRQLAP